MAISSVIPADVPEPKIWVVFMVLTCVVVLSGDIVLARFMLFARVMVLTHVMALAHVMVLAVHNKLEKYALLLSRNHPESV